MKEAHQQGAPAIDCDKMLSYLEQLKKSAEVEIEVSRELARYAHERNLEHYRSTIQTVSKSSASMFSAVLETGASAVKSVILINGGAAVALLAFLSNAWGKGIVNSGMNILSYSLYMFGLGVFFGAISMGFRFLSQACYGHALEQTIKTILDKLDKQTPFQTPDSRVRKLGHFFQFLSIIAGLAAYIAFFWGLNKAITAFTSQ